MNIREMENASGMTRGNIRFYEKEGLLTPKRRENGYRDYDEKDLEALRKIRLLRELGLSLEQIKELQMMPDKLSTFLEWRESETLREIEVRRGTHMVCEEIRRERVSYDTLRPQKYLNRLQRLQEQELVSMQIREPRFKEKTEGIDAWKVDEEAMTLHPWKRFFARALDLMLCRLCVLFLWDGVLRVPVFTSIVGELLVTWASLGWMLLIEPLFLAVFGTTPGKWILGIQVHEENGRKLTYREAMHRTVRLILRGMGLGIPIWEWYKWYQGYREYTKNGRTSWDQRIDYQIKERKVWEIVLPAAVVIFLYLGGIWWIVMWQMLPPNRGALTIADFAENYNYYVQRGAGGTFVTGGVLGENGQFSAKSSDQMSDVVIQMLDSDATNVKFVYRMEGEYITGISFEQRVSVLTANLLNGYLDEMQCAALAYLAADEDVKIWNGGMMDLLGKLQHNMTPLLDYNYKIRDTAISCDVEFDEEEYFIYFLIEKE